MFWNPFRRDIPLHDPQYIYYEVKYIPKSDVPDAEDFYNEAKTSIIQDIFSGMTTERKKKKSFYIYIKTIHKDELELYEEVAEYFKEKNYAVETHHKGDGYGILNEFICKISWNKKIDKKEKI